MRRVHLFACSFLVVGLTACGGGGGGGDGGSASSGSSGVPFPPQTPLTFGGVSTAAVITANNAGTITANVMGEDRAAAGGGAVAGVSAQSDASSAPQPGGATGLARRLAQATRQGELAKASSSALAGAAIDQTTACDSGNIHVTGTVADNGTGTVNVAYNACRTGTDTVNGPASLKIDSAQNGVITDGTLTITRINFSGPGVNSDLTGTLRTQIDTSAQTQTLTENVITQDTSTGHQSKTENLVIFNKFDNVLAPTFFTEDIRGRVFDGVAGFVDVTTQTAPFTAPWGPLYFATSAQSFPDWGIIVLTGATNGSIRVTSFGIDLAKVEVDANGDGTYENAARIRWADLNTPVGADLADSDGDGMHNSWETANGLNPNANDAAGDADADGYSNLAEYLAGSSPSTNGSIPEAVRKVWITGVHDLAFDSVSGMIDVFTGATGSGVQLNPVNRELGATFSGVAEPGGRGNTSVTDAQGRVFTLTATANPMVWTLSSSTGTSITISNVAGTNPGSLIRYGDRGLAFVTDGASGPGYVYLVESRVLIP
jgi:hypothetical protein